MPVFSNRPSAMDEMCTSATHTIEITPMLSNNQPLINRPLTTDELSDEQLKCFLSVPFTHHYEIAIKCSTIEERLFYIERAAKEIWSVEKLNFYLSALDDIVRLPHENPSIGIILCRGKSEKTVEYALRDTTKPMGVATYRGANELPKNYSNVLAGLDALIELV